jgi:regulator of protease activity HflC (stomatin/prohibitin superfamily)
VAIKQKETLMITQTLHAKTINGYAMLTLNLLLYVFVFALFIWGAVNKDIGMILTAGLTIVVNFFISAGFFTLQPNQNAVLILFGEYKGDVADSGFHWANPFLTKKKISLRVRNFNTETLKVNDKKGNPIEIASVVVWRVKNPAMAVFDVDDYEQYVEIQSESAIRHLATLYPYDLKEQHEDITLRGSTDEIAEQLSIELQERLKEAGVDVREARISHLAYAPEIASAMLQRQQAEAIVDARSTIVEGAVSMVEMALEKLKNSEQVIDMDADRQAAMVSNLLVVLCGDKAAHPVINAGTLHH